MVVLHEVIFYIFISYINLDGSGTKIKVPIVFTVILASIDAQLDTNSSFGSAVMHIVPIAGMIAIQRAYDTPCTISAPCASNTQLTTSLVIDLAWSILSNLYVINFIARIIRKRAHHSLHFTILFGLHIITTCNPHQPAEFIIRIPLFYVTAAVVHFAPSVLVIDEPMQPPHVSLCVSLHLLFVNPYIATASFLAFVGLFIRIYFPNFIISKENNKRSTPTLAPPEFKDTQNKQVDEDDFQQFRLAIAVTGQP